MADRILVSTQDLINAANEFQNRSNNINNTTTEMLNLARGLNSQWEGTAAESFVSRFNELEDDMAMVKNMITANVKKLEEIANIMEKAELDVNNLTQVNTNLIS